MARRRIQAPRVVLPTRTMGALLEAARSMQGPCCPSCAGPPADPIARQLGMLASLGGSLADTATSMAISNSISIVSGGKTSMADLAATDQSTLEAQGKAYLDSQTTDEANKQRIAAGEQAGMDLVNGGCQWENSTDCADKSVAVVAGVCALFAPYGTLAAAIIEGVYQLSKVIAKWINPQIAYCRTTGNFTPKMALTASSIPTPPPPGSFRAVALQLFATSWAGFYNCFPPGSLWWDVDTLLLSALNAWNVNSTGNLIDYFVPRPNSINAAPLNPHLWMPVPPPSQYGKGAGIFAYVGEGVWNFAPYAFVPLSQVPSYIASPAQEGNTWIRVAANAGPATPPPPVPVKTVKIQLVHRPPAASTATAPKPASSSSSSGAGVVVLAGAAGAAWWLAKMGGWSKVRRMLG